MICIFIEKLKGRTIGLNIQNWISKSLFVTGVVSLTISYSIVPARSQQSDYRENTELEHDRSTSEQSNSVEPVGQQKSYPHSNGSQHFFRQGNDNLYFLPEDKSNSILQIDENIEEDDVEAE